MLADALGARRQRRAVPLGRRHADLSHALAEIAALHARGRPALRHPARRGSRDRDRSAGDHASTARAAARRSDSTGCRWACRTSRPTCRRPSTASSPRTLTRALFDEARRARVRVDQHRSDLRPAAADARVVRAHARRGRRRCGPTASPCTPTRTCRGFEAHQKRIDPDDAAAGRARRSSCSSRRWTRFLRRRLPADRHGSLRAAGRRARRAPRRRRAASQLHGLHDAPGARHGGAGVSAIGDVRGRVRAEHEEAAHVLRRRSTPAGSRSSAATSSTRTIEIRRHVITS